MKQNVSSIIALILSIIMATLPAVESYGQVQNVCKLPVDAIGKHQQAMKSDDDQAVLTPLEDAPSTTQTIVPEVGEKAEADQSTGSELADETASGAAIVIEETDELTSGSSIQIDTEIVNVMTSAKEH